MDNFRNRILNKLASKGPARSIVDDTEKDGEAENAEVSDLVNGVGHLSLKSDGKRVLECLQRALRTADSILDSNVSLELFIEILNQSLYFFIHGNILITVRYLNGLIELIDLLDDFQDEVLSKPPGAMLKEEKKGSVKSQGEISGDVKKKGGSDEKSDSSAEKHDSGNTTGKEDKGTGKEGQGFEALLNEMSQTDRSRGLRRKTSRRLYRRRCTD